ncbi:hypothetical protein SAMN05428970_0745 [Agromyces sp. CF514]|uniref:hypothetical protein n=1 Tax=Agromyces sp. CF514 TaxID=1881031 RepID=UPI0008EA15E6|nr:hypothetical protein [Agromyces sp. CF514]SFR69628.1 hypothetical protein SAMN05428970_0745 [Agromyces sp. CF514]
MTENTSRPTDADDAAADATDVIDTDAATEAFATTPLPPASGSPMFAPPADPAASLDDAVYAASVAPLPAPVAAARPTVRWGALVWALIFGATAALTLWVLVDPARRLAADEWIAALNPLAASLYALIAIGVVVALFGVVGLIRRGERARRAAVRS